MSQEGICQGREEGLAAGEDEYATVKDGHCKEINDW